MISKALLWGILVLLLAAVCGVAVYKAWPVLFPEVAVSIPADPACDLRAGPCLSTVENGAVSFAIEPRSIPLVKPVQLRVELHGGVKAQQVAVDFSGVDMNMGFNRFQLKPAGEGIFTGQGLLPVCVRDAMEWEARVLLTSEKGLTSVAYRFITVRSGLPLPDK